VRTGVRQLHVSARSCHRMLSLARTIADPITPDSIETPPLAPRASAHTRLALDNEPRERHN
jgi:hypothetical protein